MIVLQGWGKDVVYVFWIGVQYIVLFFSSRIHWSRNQKMKMVPLTITSSDPLANFLYDCMPCCPFHDGRNLMWSIYHQVACWCLRAWCHIEDSVLVCCWQIKHISGHSQDSLGACLSSWQRKSRIRKCITALKIWAWPVGMVLAPSRSSCMVLNSSATAPCFQSFCTGILFQSLCYPVFCYTQLLTCLKNFLREEFTFYLSLT